MMLRSVVETLSTLKFGARVREDVLWLLSEANKLADKRNDALHSPYMFMASPTSEPVMASYLFDNPRALKFRGKELLKELVCYRKSADVLTEFASKIVLSIDSGSTGWPERPAMPHLGEKPARRKKPAS
jgi:hypothetical protein